jgi:hypothetical protein
MTIDPHHETEDFEKTITFESGQFAILDAEVAKSLKDKVPLSDMTVFVATKQSRDNPSPFKITAEYDDATLRRLVIEPAVPGEEHNDHHQVEEGVQILGHEGDAVKKKKSRVDRIGGNSRPKSGDRSTRNKKRSGQGDQKAKLTKGKSSVEQRVEQAISIDGAKRDNYGQPLHKTNISPLETECVELLAKAKEGLLSESYLSSLNNLREIRVLLADVRDNNRVVGKSFDMVYSIIQQLDEHWHKSACVWVEDIVKKGHLDV